MSSCEGPLATVPENGSFKVREVRAKEQKKQLLQMRGCLDALGLEKGRHPAGKKATHRVPGLAHSLIKQEQYNGAGWDPQKPHGWMSSSASPHPPALWLSFRLGSPIGRPQQEVGGGEEKAMRELSQAPMSRAKLIALWPTALDPMVYSPSGSDTPPCP